MAGGCGGAVGGVGVVMGPPAVLANDDGGGGGGSGGGGCMAAGSSGVAHGAAHARLTVAAATVLA